MCPFGFLRGLFHRASALREYHKDSETDEAESDDLPADTTLRTGNPFTAGDRSKVDLVDLRSRRHAWADRSRHS
jgi:hypothetical protein